MTLIRNVAKRPFDLSNGHSLEPYETIDLDLSDATHARLLAEGFVEVVSGAHTPYVDYIVSLPGVRGLWDVGVDTMPNLATDASALTALDPAGTGQTVDAAGSSGAPSLLPGDPTYKSFQKLQNDLPVGTIPNSAGLTTSGKLTMGAWVRPESLRAGTGIMAREAVAFILQDGEFFSGQDAPGTAVCKSGGEFVGFGSPYFIVYTYEQGVAARLFVNGIVVAEDLTPGSLPNSTNMLVVGGTAVFSTAVKGFRGGFQWPMFGVEALTVDQVRRAFELGSAPALEGATRFTVQPWSRRLFSKGTRPKLITNNSEARFYVTKGAPATVGAGQLLLPGDTLRVYSDSDVHVVSDALMGGKYLGVS